MTGLPWDASYHHGPAPWDSGRPQPTVAAVDPFRFDGGAPAWFATIERI